MTYIWMDTSKLECEWTKLVTSDQMWREGNKVHYIYYSMVQIELSKGCQQHIMKMMENGLHANKNIMLLKDFPGMGFSLPPPSYHTHPIMHPSLYINFNFLCIIHFHVTSLLSSLIGSPWAPPPHHYFF